MDVEIADGEAGTEVWFGYGYDNYDRTFVLLEVINYIAKVCVLGLLESYCSVLWQ